jgi:uncharacterized cupredoxin-like copper-binding protein
VSRPTGRSTRRRSGHSDGDNIDPGRLQARTVDLTQPGTYVLLCNLPNHFKSGMYATITVTS